MAYELIKNPDGIGERMVEVIPRNPKEFAPSINVNYLLRHFWASEAKEIKETGLLNGEYVEVSITRNRKGNTIIEIWEI